MITYLRMHPIDMSMSGPCDKAAVARYQPVDSRGAEAAAHQAGRQVRQEAKSWLTTAVCVSPLLPLLHHRYIDVFNTIKIYNHGMCAPSAQSIGLARIG
jgi:hypothetical protein